MIQLALGFVTAHPAVTSALIGPRTLDHLHSQLAAADTVLSADVLDAIDAIVAPGIDLAPHEKFDTPPALLDAVAAAPLKAASKATHAATQFRDHDRPDAGRLPRRPAGLARGGRHPGDRARVAVRSPHADRRRPGRTDLRRLDAALGPCRTDPTTAPRPARDQQPLPAARDAGQDRRDRRHRLRRAARLRHRRGLTTRAIRWPGASTRRTACPSTTSPTPWGASPKRAR